MNKTIKLGKLEYHAFNIGILHASFEVTKDGDFVKDFDVQTIGDELDPEPDFSGVPYLTEKDIIAIETILPLYPTSHLRKVYLG